MKKSVTLYSFKVIKEPPQAFAPCLTKFRIHYLPVIPTLNSLGPITLLNSPGKAPIQFVTYSLILCLLKQVTVAREKSCNHAEQIHFKIMINHLKWPSNTLIYFFTKLTLMSNILFPFTFHSPIKADDTASHLRERIDDTRGELLIFPSLIPPTFLLL